MNAALLAQTGFHPPQTDFPLLGPTLPIAIVFSIHIAIAEYSAGAISIAPAMELYGVRRGSAWAMRYARALANSYYLVFSLGATFAVFAIVLITGLWPAEAGLIFNQFIPVFALAFGLFLILAPLLVLYRNSFGRLPPRIHVGLGFAVMFWQLLFVVCIVTLDAYLIDPLHGGFLATTLNPPYWPLLLHRLIGNVSWTALILAAFALLRRRAATTDEDRDFQAWAARLNLRIGLLTAVLMPVGGFVIIEVVHTFQPGYFDGLVTSDSAWLFIVQEALTGVIFAGGNLALSFESTASPLMRTFGRVAAGVSVAGFAVGCLPAAVIGPGILWARYVAIGAATAITLVHVVARSLPRRRGAVAAAERSVNVPGPARLLGAVGVASVAVALLMGYIKEHARAAGTPQYSVYGELTQQDARQPYAPPPGTYP